MAFHENKGKEELSIRSEKYGIGKNLLDEVLEANRIMEQYPLGTLGLRSDNERSSTETLYLQFEASQRTNAVDFMTAKEYRDRLLIATDAHPEVATP